MLYVLRHYFEWNSCWCQPEFVNHFQVGSKLALIHWKHYPAVWVVKSLRDFFTRKSCVQCRIAFKFCRYHLIQIALDPTCSAQPLIACQIPASFGSADCLFMVTKNASLCCVKDHEWNFFAVSCFQNYFTIKMEAFKVTDYLWKMSSYFIWLDHSKKIEITKLFA